MVDHLAKEALVNIIIIKQAVVALMLMLILSCCSSDENPLGADMVLAGGAIYTIDPANPWAEAVAIRDGKIVYVGDTAGASAFTTEKTQVVELNGRMLMPGMHDAHIHPIMGGLEILSCGLHELKTLQQYLEKIALCASEHPERPWIRGGGWSMAVFGPGALANKELLDSVVPDRPVYLASADGHSGWVNSRALALAGLDAGTPNPVGGIIDRDANTGELIGSLQEQSAMDLVAGVIPMATDAEHDAALRYAVNMLSAYGITGIQDAWIRDEEELRTYQRLQEEGELNVRVVASLYWEPSKGLKQLDAMKILREQFSKDLFQVTTVKIMQDGVMENYTAVLTEPYLLEEETLGIPMLEPETLKEAVTAIDSAGFQVHFHAIGDGAIQQSLDAVEFAIQSNGSNDNHHHISHLQLINPVDIRRFAELNVTANFQPLWAFPDEYITELTDPFIGHERSGWHYAIGSVLRAGGKVAFGSDWTVSSANPFEQIEVAITRADPLGDTDQVLLPQERISLEDALQAFTLNAAFVNHLEEQTGSIEVGKQADLALLDQNLFRVAPEAISDTKVLLTLFEGKVVYGHLDGL